MPSQVFETIVSMMEGRTDTDLPLHERRAQIEEGAKAMPPPADVVFTEVDVNGVPAEWVDAPGSSDERVILYLHGGAYVICSPRTHRRLTAALSRQAKARVLALDYRLAPENPFPGAVEDAVAGYRFLLDGGIDASRIVIAGDSAGGGLAIATLLSSRDSGLPMPAGAVVISPWTDLELDSESAVSRAALDPMIEPEHLRGQGRQYAGHDLRNPLASPVHADLTGLPPLYVAVGGREVLLSDATRLVERAKECGVQAELDLDEEMIHVWHLFAGMMPESDEAVARVATFLDARFG